MIYEYPMEDDSWAVELAEFIDDIRLDREPRPGLADAVAVLRIVERIYKESSYGARDSPTASLHRGGGEVL